MILAETGDELSRGQARDWHTDGHTHTQTDAGNDNTRTPIMASGNKKIVIRGDECIIIFLTCYFMPWMHNFTKNQLSIADFDIVAKDGLFWHRIVTSTQLICDVKRTWGTGIVTSNSSIVLARANWRSPLVYYREYRFITTRYFLA